MSRIVHSLLLMALPGICQAAELRSPGTGVVQMLLGLGLVLACLFGALWVLKRLQSGGLAGNSPLRVLGATSVGQRERVVLVAVGQKVLVLGVAPGRINALHTLDASELPAVEPQTPIGADFASRLREFMNKNKGGADAH